VTLTGVSIADELDGLSDIAYGEWPVTEGTLAPGQSVTATATYELTQTDVNDGVVENTATVTGTPPSGDPVEDPDDHTQPLPQQPSRELLKSGGLAEGSRGAAGDVVEYAFTLTNTGNVTVTDAAITDPLEGLSEISYGEWPGETGVLEP